MNELITRSKRKLDHDGIGPLLTEARYLLFESKQVRERLSRRLLDGNDIDVLVYDELFELGRASGRVWSTFDDENTPVVEPIPPKTRVAASSSFERLDAHTPVAPAVIEVPDCTIIHPFGLTVCERGVVQESIAKSTTVSSRTAKALAKSVSDHGYREIDSLVAETYTGPHDSVSVAAPMLMLWTNYYHWTLECLPRLAGVERYCRATGIKPTVILPEDPASWMLESLDMLGIDEGRRHELDTHCTVDRLVVSTHPGPTTIECRWLRNRMQSASRGSSTIDRNTSHRVYVSRRNATRRRVRNEERLIEVLRTHGFTPYALEDLSIANQVALFENAEAVVSPHGAGLANLVYSDSTTVIELFGTSKKTTFYRLADLCGHDYYHVNGDTRRGDLVVNVDRVRKLLVDVGLDDGIDSEASSQ